MSSKKNKNTRKKNKDTQAATLEKLPYRRGVGAVLFNREGLVWVGRRIPRPGQKIENYWQMPQGGIDKGEEPVEAVFRELKEEAGTDQAELVAETRSWLTYDLPEDLKGVAWKGKFKGQKQKWFALRFTGDDSDFDLDGHAKPEFDAWKWVELTCLPRLIVPFKRVIYDGIVKEFKAVPGKLGSGKTF